MHQPAQRRTRHLTSRGVATLLSVALITCSTSTAATNLNRLKALSLEQLANLEVSIIGKTPQRLASTPAAVYVITREDIRRSTATRLPDLLRMVPGFNVARQEADDWAISSRGFISHFANKLLVMIDGRSVYTPLFSGTLWESQDLLLEDIERIEVVRGPGAATWGANAVNGVVNVITRNAADTQGVLATGVLGTEQAGGWLRQGGTLGDDGHYRVYARHHYHEPSSRPGGGKADDGLSGIRGGFRTDWTPTADNSYTLQGDAYYEDTDNPNYKGANLLGRWEQALDDGNATYQVYYDWTDIRTEDLVDEQLHTIDLDYSRQLDADGRHSFNYGLGYRFMHSDAKPQMLNVVHKRIRRSQLFSGFIQDTIALIPDTLSLTLGAKIEHNDYTGFEFQPNARLAWNPTPDTNVWAAISRAVRSPSRGENDATITGPVGTIMGLPLINFVDGKGDFESETLIAHELGFRTQLTDTFNLDVALFYNDYDDLRSVEFDQPFPTPVGLPPTYFALPFTIDNKNSAETYGIEIAADWRPRDDLRFTAAYSFVNIEVHSASDSTDEVGYLDEGRTPQHQLSLHSAIDLGPNTELDLWGYYADNAPTVDVPSYVDLDVRLAHRFSRNFSVELTGRHLLDPNRQQVGPDAWGPLPQEIDREFFVKFIWTD